VTNATPTWVEQDRLLVGAYPLPEDIAELERTGITLFVDLTEAGEVGEYALASARHVRVAIPDFGVPTDTQMRVLLDVIDDELERGGRVYLHCRGGCGRTGTVVGCWLVRHGRSGEEALSLLGRCPETDEQRELVLSWQHGR
jgi:protein-tyrosine phosphatase